MAVTLVGVVVSVGLSILAGYLLRKKQKGLLRDDKPTTLTLRGARTNYVTGLSRVGPIFAFAGARVTAKERPKGGKGSVFSSLSPKQTVYYEDGWHILAVGPGYALTGITENGELIFDGPITKDSHPSGTLVDLGAVGSFRMWWGEERQDVNTFLADASRVGISSRWPYFLYIEWRKKRLGSQTTWPLLTYDLHVKPNAAACAAAGLTGDGYFEPTQSLTGGVRAIFSVTNGVPGTAKFTMIGDFTNEFRPSWKFRLTGNAIPDQDFVALRAFAYLFEISPPIPPYIKGVYQIRTDVFPTTTLSGATAAGNLQGYTPAKDDGYNPAHLFAHALFAEAPMGQARSTKFYDLVSLQAAATLWQTEGLRCRLLGTEATTFEKIIGGLMLDAGVMMPVDQNTGLIRWVPQRETTYGPSVPFLPEQLIATDGIELERRLSGLFADEVAFVFENREYEYREDPILFSNDGSTARGKHANTRTANVESTVHFDTAYKIARRRAAEDLSPNSHFGIDALRGVRTLIVGTVIEIEGVDTLVRVTSLLPQEKTEQCRLEGFADNYGAKPNSQNLTKFGNGEEPQRAVEDPIVIPVEVPEFALDSTNTPTVIVPRVRAHSGIRGADIYLSGDQNSYDLLGFDDDHAQGGTLLQALPGPEGFQFIETGPTFTIAGPDVALALDLTGDEENWKLGRQVCVVDDEVMFLRNVEILSPTTARLRGLIRSRYDTAQVSHSVGAKLAIFERESVFAIQDPLLLPDRMVSIKAVPFAASAMSVASVTPHDLPLYGKGIKPPPPGKPTTTKITEAYVTGESITFRWGYKSPRAKGTGAGLFGAGAPVLAADPEGDFVLEILDASLVLKRTVVQPGTTYAYANADLISDFGSEPASYRVRVSQRRAGYTSSPSPVLTITKT